MRFRLAPRSMTLDELLYVRTFGMLATVEIVVVGIVVVHVGIVVLLLEFRRFGTQKQLSE